jgi:hypothetical protein
MFAGVGKKATPRSGPGDKYGSISRLCICAVWRSKGSGYTTTVIAVAELCTYGAMSVKLAPESQCSPKVLGLEV